MTAPIDGPAGTLEIDVVESQDATAPFAVICHPHPLHGGTMDNKVVTTVARALQSCGMPTIRFNFRGVGASTGAYDEGRGETDDALSVAAWGEAHWPGRALVLAGFSFGAFVAMRAAQRRTLARLITIAPPVDRFAFDKGLAPQVPWLVIQGSADEIVPAEAVSAWVRDVSSAARLVLLPGVSHFFHGHLHELREVVVGEIRGDGH